MTTVAQYLGQSKRREVREAVAGARVDKASVFLPLDFKQEEDEDGRLFFEGFANTTNIDRGGDRIRPAAWRKTVGPYLKNNPQVFYMHDWYMSIGQVTEAKVMKEGLWVRGYVQPPTDEDDLPVGGFMGDFLRMVRGQVARGQLRTLSVGIRILESKLAKVRNDAGDMVEVRDIKDLELFEVSLVTVPMNRESVIEARKALAAVHGDDVANSLVSVYEDDADLESYYSTREEDDQEQPESKTGPTLELVSLKHRQPNRPEIEVVSLKESRR